MEKIEKLIDILDDNIVDKLIILDRVVKLHARFLTKWRVGEITSNGTVVRVRFSYVDKYKRENWTEREFPMEDISKRISSYKRKIKIEFANRHDNVRIQREKKIRMWQKHIKDANVQM